MKKSVVASLLVVALLGTSLASQAQALNIDQLHDYDDGDQVDQYQLQDDEGKNQVDDYQLLNDVDEDPAHNYLRYLVNDGINVHNNDHQLDAHEIKRQPRIWLPIVLTVGKIVLSLLRTGEVKLLGHSCHYSQESFQGYYRGLIACPGWTSIVGHAVTKDSSKVLQATIENFLKKAIKTGLITEKDFEDFLQSATTQPPTAS